MGGKKKEQFFGGIEWPGTREVQVPRWIVVVTPPARTSSEVLPAAAAFMVHRFLPPVATRTSFESSGLKFKRFSPCL